MFDELTPPYSCIVADPPWPLKWSGGAGGKHRNATPLRYSLMTLDDIKAMPVGRIAAQNAHLYLWVTPELNRKGEGVATAEAWGFTVVDEIIWEKPNFGVGVFPRHCHEPLLICRRGELPFTGRRDVRSVQKWKQPQNSNGGKTPRVPTEAGCAGEQFQVRRRARHLHEVKRARRFGRVGSLLTQRFPRAWAALPSLDRLEHHL